MAAAYGVGAAGEVLVVIDIGGGSVEITRGAGPTMESGRSFKLGVIRLTERFVKSDPISEREERKLVRHIDADVGEHIESHPARRLRPRRRHVGHDPEPRRDRRRTPWPRRAGLRCETAASRRSSCTASAAR